MDAAVALINVVITILVAIVTVLVTLAIQKRNNDNENERLRTILTEDREGRLAIIEHEKELARQQRLKDALATARNDLAELLKTFNYPAPDRDTVGLRNRALMDYFPQALLASRIVRTEESRKHLNEVALSVNNFLIEMRDIGDDVTPDDYFRQVNRLSRALTNKLVVAFDAVEKEWLADVSNGLPTVGWEDHLPDPDASPAPEGAGPTP